MIFYFICYNIDGDFMQYFDNNENLRSEIRKLNYSYDGCSFVFNSDLGVFSKDKIDEGSKLLAESYFKYGKRDVHILDVGCGVGFLGITISKIMNAKVDMIDVNNRAIHLCKMNLKENGVSGNVFNSDVYSNISDSYDVIISNPPIRAGKSVYLKIIDEAFNHLNEGGELWFVMRTNHGVKTVIKNLNNKYNTLVVAKDKGFYVVKVYE